MRKKLQIIVCCALLMALCPFVAGAAEPITITQQPQNGSFPENAVAMWYVAAEEKDLSYDWFIVYDGVAYNTKKSFSEQHPWLAGVTGDGYGSNDVGNAFFINGIGSALNGAEIYCVISDGIYSVTSAAAYITVGAPTSPPELVVPASAEAEKGQPLKLSCRATAPNADRIASYLWYETPTGALKDIVAIGAKAGDAETDAVLACDTTQVGTRYYVCAVTTEKGGTAYSSVIPVTVRDVPKTESTPTVSESPDRPPASTVSPESGSSVSESRPAKTESHAENPPEPDPSVPRRAIAWVPVCGGIAIGGGVVAVLIRKKKANRTNQSR